MGRKRESTSPPRAPNVAADLDDPTMEVRSVQSAAPLPFAFGTQPNTHADVDRTLTRPDEVDAAIVATAARLVRLQASVGNAADALESGFVDEAQARALAGTLREVVALIEALKKMR